MPPTLTEYLKYRSTKQYRAFCTLLNQVPEAAALLYATESWPGHRWGVGQNGSIAGIVYHVAAWKALTLPVFQPGGEPLPAEALDAASAPDLRDWEGIKAWYFTIGEEWDSTIQQLPEDALDEVHLWEGHPTPLYSFVSELMEHDLQHASQIEYLLQRASAEGIPV